jgi:hypothetical protein
MIPHSVILEEIDSKEYLLETLETLLKQFSEMPGLHINLYKTRIVWTGSKKYSNEILLPNYKLLKVGHY